MKKERKKYCCKCVLLGRGITSGVTRDERAGGKNCDEHSTYTCLFEGQIFSSFHTFASVSFFRFRNRLNTF
jgi:hypothetical protein